ncbi:MAG: hypothetical protein E7557_03705 [Ruminococcaceae bacterium]|nr:hypothetical protein [Oscillospiraceae bacterium]
MKKVLSLLLALVFVIAAFPVTIASAADVIEISDASQLASIGNDDSYPLNGSYKLTKSISLSGYDNWTPIGQSSAFSGTFEGNGKTISGLKVNTSGTYAGLFGQVSGTIKNLTVTGSVTLNATSNSATSVYAGILAGNVSGWFATIDSCSTTGEVSATLNCTASMSFFGSANVYAGGVIGNSSSWIAMEVLSHKSGTVTASYSGSKVSGNTYAGGIVGKTSAGLVDCYNKANVTSSSGNGSSYAGGLAGQCASTETSYNTGTITAGTYAGGIAGYTSGSSKNCYYLSGSASQGFGGSSSSSTPTATSKKSTEMWNKNLTGFNFDDVWESSLISAPNHYSKNEIITGSVSVLGSFQVGEKLTADMSKVTPASAYNGTLIKYVNYQWERGTKDSDGNIAYEKISGATSDSYTLTSNDLGKYVRLVVRGRFTYGGKLESKEALVSAAVPKNVKVSTADDGVKVSWDKISGATSYTIYRSTYSEGIFGIGAGFNSYSSVGTSSTNSFLDTTVTTNTKYKYKVSVTMGGTESDQSAESAEITAQLACQHNWDSGKETTSAKCETAGVRTYTCSLCKGTRTETIPALGHSYNNGTVTKKATCTEAGTKTFTCSTCWNSKTETIPALGHSYGTATVTKAATCEEAGTKASTCANCGDQKTQTIPATGHTFDATNVIKNPTCTEPGLKRGNCKTCGQYKEETPAALGHAFSSDFTVDKEATYEATGEKSRHCSRCDARTDVTVIPKLIKITEPVHKEQRTKNGVTVTWEKVENATGYNVYKATKSSSGTWSAWSKIKALNSTTLTYTDTYVESGKSYRYAVSATANGEETTYSSNREIIYLAEPVIKTTEVVAKGIKFTWGQVSGVEGYIVYKLVDGEYQQVAVQAASNTTYIDQKAVNGQTYYYAVASMDYIGNPGSLNKFSVKYDIPVVKDLATPVVKTENSAKGIKLTWGKVENANTYIVYKRTYNEATKKYSGWTVLNKAYTGTTYTDTKVKLNTIYSYTVKAVNGDVVSKYTATKGLRYNVTPTVTVANVSNGVKVSWTTAANATGYRVYSSTYNTKTKKWSGWKNRGTAKANATSWVDKTTKSGTYYKYTVRAVNGTFLSSYNKTGVKTLYLSQPTVKIANNASGMKVTWNKIAGSKGYTVYRSEYVNGKWSSWKNMGTTKNTVFAWVDKSADSGTTYRYTVRAVNGSYKSNYKATSGLMFLSQPAVTVAKATNGIRVSWSKTDGATSYVIYRSEYNAKTKKWSSWKNLSTSKSIIASYTDKTAISGKIYRYTVKAVNGNAKSTYAASNSVKR